MPGLLHEDYFVLCGELEEDLRAMVRWLVEVCRRRGLKFNVGKNKVMVMNGVEGLECEVHEDGLRLKHVPEFEYLDEAGTDGAECSRKIANGRREAGAIRSLVNCRDLQIECARVLHERLLVPVLKYGSKTIL